MSSNSSTFNLRFILEKEKLNGQNFLDWFRNLRIVLKQERKLHVLDGPVPVLAQDATDEQIQSVILAEGHSNDVTCLMLATMVPDLQKKFEHMDAFSIIGQLKNMFQEKARTERYETNKAILDCKLEKGSPVGPHVLKMIGLFESIARLGFPYSQELATDIILRSLHDGFDSFKLNYNMHGMEKSLEELHGMLKAAEPKIQEENKNGVLMIQKGRVAKPGKKKPIGKAKGTSKPATAPKPQPTSGKSKAAQCPPDARCFYCEGRGHYKKDCPKLREDRKNGCVASTSGIF